MAYTINKQDGTPLSISAGLVTPTTDYVVQFIGKNSADYGPALNQNFLRITENFASDTQPNPTNLLTGQLWYDKTNLSLKVYDGTRFNSLAKLTTSNVVAASATVKEGDLWFDKTTDPVNKALKIYNGNAWVKVGESTFSSNAGTSGTITGTVDSSIGASKTVTAFYIDGNVVAVLSGSDFTMGTGASTLTTDITTSFGSNANLYTGFTFSSPTVKLVGTATNSEKLGNIDANGYVTTTGNGQVISGVVQFSSTNEAGVSFGNASQFRIAGGSSTLVRLQNTVNSGDIAVNVVNSGSSVEALRIFSNTQVRAASYAATTSVVVGNVTINTGNVIPASNISGTIGSSTRYFANVFANAVTAETIQGRASSAEYADLAERFASDNHYLPGTLVRVGGFYEVTLETKELSEDVIGVISTAPAYLMNAEVGDEKSHPAVVLSGRVPVRATGKINKGDRLVSAGNGIARAATSGEVTPFNVIGRALEDKKDSTENTVLAIVRINI
jgi:hypothetical protein